MTVQLTVNGKSLEIEAEMRLPEFLAAGQINQRHIAVARNGEVLDRDSYGAVILRAGDVIEIVRMVGGG